MTSHGGGWSLVLHGADIDIGNYDGTGDSSWTTGATTIDYSSINNSFKFDDSTLNSIRDG